MSHLSVFPGALLVGAEVRVKPALGRVSVVGGRGLLVSELALLLLPQPPPLPTPAQAT